MAGKVYGQTLFVLQSTKSVIVRQLCGNIWCGASVIRVWTNFKEISVGFRVPANDSNPWNPKNNFQY